MFSRRCNALKTSLNSNNGHMQLAKGVVTQDVGWNTEVTLSKLKDTDGQFCLYCLYLEDTKGVVTQVVGWWEQHGAYTFGVKTRHFCDHA